MRERGHDSRRASHPAPHRPSDRALRWLARTLPREFRERVFEPALADVHLDEAAHGRRPWARVALAAEALRLGLPRHFWRRNRPTRITLALGVAAIVIAFVVARLHYAAQWKEAPVHARVR